MAMTCKTCGGIGQVSGKIIGNTVVFPQPCPDCMIRPAKCDRCGTTYDRDEVNEDGSMGHVCKGEDTVSDLPKPPPGISYMTPEEFLMSTPASKKDDGGLKMKYFVLNPTKSDAYGQASRHAIVAYSMAIHGENPHLAADLEAWLKELVERDTPPT